MKSHLLYKQIALAIIYAMHPFFLFPQEDTAFHWNEITLEEYVESREAEEMDIQEELSGIIPEEGMKYNINALSAEVACGVLQMTDYQYYQLLLYIEQYGELVTLHELSGMDGFPAEFVASILPYLYVKKKDPDKKGFFKNLKYGKGEVLLRYIAPLPPSAFCDTAFLGSMSRIAFKVKYTDNRHLSIGFAGEKDPGEGIFSPPYRQGFDHYAGHLRIHGLGILQTLIAGNFRIGWGQGLVLGAGLAGGTGNGVEGLRKFPSSPQAVTAMNEGNYFCGVATSLGTAHWQGTLFYGEQYFDADLAEDTALHGLLYEGRLSLNGSHRTIPELAKKKGIKNRNAGMEFRYQWRLFRLGIRSLAQFLNVELSPSGALYRLYDFTGKRLFNNSVDYNLIVGKVVLFGEIASSNLSGYALLQGLLFSPDPRIKSGILFRKYSKSYHAFSGNAFGANSRNQCETGIYLSQEIILGRKNVMSLSVDFYQIEWLRYRIDKPSSGEDFTLRFQHSIDRDTELAFTYLYRKKQKNNTGLALYHEIIPIRKQQGKVSFSYGPFPGIKGKTHAELVLNQYGDSKERKIGYLIYQDFSYSGKRIPLVVRSRIAFFDTDSYEERIYAYEHDLQQVFNISGYYQRGWRGYICLKYRYSFFNIEIRYSHTEYVDKKEAENGSRRSNGNEKNEIKAQLLFHF